MNEAEKFNVGLFVTCPVDLIRPSIGFSTVKLLEQANCKVGVPVQSCCGQVAYNNGDPEGTIKLAWQIVEDFSPYDYIVIPSGSCGGMIKMHYPELFASDPRLEQVKTFCTKVYELTTFLTEIAGRNLDTLNCDLSDKTITYHDSCAGLRELNIKQQPRQLLKQLANVNVKEMQNTEECCGFGGTFCVKFPEISNRMVSDKIANAHDAQAELLLGGDLSCLLNIAGKAQRQNSSKKIEVRHVAEVLAGDMHIPAIGESENTQ